MTIDVLSNDTDIDSDELTVALDGPPARGSASCDGTTCTFTAPADDPGGTITFRYQVSDPDGAAATAIVSVAVSPAASTTTSVATTSTTVPIAGELPETGTSIGATVLGALALVSAGAALTATARRRHAWPTS